MNSRDVDFPPIIQGGMGAGVSDWRLAKAVSRAGQLGVVSGTALDVILTRRLQLGDPGGHMRRALAAFPAEDIAPRIIDTYFIAGGKATDQPFRQTAMVGIRQSKETQDLLMAANFVEVFLAKEGHSGMVGINYLHKIQTPLLPSLYGALLAGVDVLTVGAGIPIELPAILDRLVAGEAAQHSLHVSGAASGDAHMLTFSPASALGGVPPKLRRPAFFPIVSSATLAAVLLKRCPGNIDGLIVEEFSAGGHNAPPRGKAQLSEEGECIYGPRDDIRVEDIRALGLPFWLAGSKGSPARLAEAQAAGATGIQVGSLFAFSAESGLSSQIKAATLARSQNPPRVFRDPVASPTGFPFQVLHLPDTLSDPQLYRMRPRQCDLGYLREAYQKEDGRVGWRCPADDPDAYVRKGGNLAATVGRKCLCNALMANIGLAQIRADGTEELPLVTCGEDLSGLPTLSQNGRAWYTATNVIDYLLSG